MTVESPHLPPAREGLVLHELVGRGATGTVHRATLDGTEVVVKFGAEGFEADRISKLFRREAAIHGGLRHPSVPRVFEVGEHEGRPYIVSEYCPGKSLQAVLAAGPLGMVRTVGLGRDLADALAAVHRQGVVHRDVKPANVLVRDDGRVHLIDFGLAAQAAKHSEGEGAGTLKYSSPEQIGIIRRCVDAPSDLYSLGLLLYECIAGEPPFDAADVATLLHCHAAVVPTPLCEVDPTCDPVFSAIVARLLCKDPDERYPSADALVTDLEQIGRLRAMQARGEEVVLGDPGARPAPRGLFLGRDAPLSAVMGVVSGPRAACALVVGNPGVGKTRLIEEALFRGISNDVPLLRAKCVEGDPYPLAPIRQAVLGLVRGARMSGVAVRQRGLAAIRRAAEGLEGVLGTLDPTLRDVLGTQGPARPVLHGRGVTSNALATFLCRLSAEHGSAVLWLDDVQWLDEASRHVLTAIASRQDQNRLKVLLSARDDAPSREALDAITMDLRGMHLRWIAVGPMTVAEVAEVVEGMVGPALGDDFVRRVTAHSRGNPFVIGQYLRAMKDGGALVPSWGRWVVDDAVAGELDLPTEIYDLLTRRVEGLGSQTHRLLGGAALLGRSFTMDLLLHIAAPAPLADVQAALSEARSAGLIETRGDGGALQFVHDRVREVLAASHAELEGQVHRRAAAYLDHLPALPGRLIFERAWHHVKGWGSDRPLPVFRACLDAARVASSEHAHGQARDLLRAAESVGGLQLVTAQERRFFHRCRGLALFHTHRIEASVPAFRAALDIATDPAMRAELRAWICRALIFAFDTSAGMAEAEAAFEELGEPLPTTTIHEPQALMGHLMTVLTSHVTEVATTAPGASLTRAQRARDAALVQLCDVVFLMGYYERQPVTALMGGVLALLPAHRLGPSREACSGFATFAMLMGLLGKADLATRFGDMAMSMARGLSDRQTLAMTQSVVAIALHFLGQADRALQLQREVFERYSDWLGPVHFQNGSIDLSWNYYVRGMAREERDVSLAAVRRLGADCGEFLAAYACRASASAASASARLGQVSLATELRAAVADYRDVVPPDRTIPWMSVEGFLVGFAHAQGDYGSSYSDAVERYRAWGIEPERSALHSRHFYISFAYGLLEQALDADGTPTADAMESLVQAVDALARVGPTPTIRAHVHALQAHVAMLQGDVDAAARSVAGARELAREFHNPWALFEVARVEAAILAAAGRSDAAAHESWSALTLARRHGWKSRVRILEHQLGADSASMMETQGSSLSATQLTGHPEAGGPDLRYKAQLDGLLSLSRATSAVIDADEQARIALDEIVRQLGAERGYLFVVDGDGVVPRFWRGRSAGGEDLLDAKDFSRTAIDRVVEQQSAVLVGSPQDAAELTAQSVLAYDLRSILAAPLFASDQLLGVVYVDNRLAHGVFTSDQLELLQALGNHLASAIQTARTVHLEVELKAETQRRHLAETLQALIADVTSTLNLTEGLARLLDALGREIHFTRGAAVVMDEGHPLTHAVPGIDSRQVSSLMRCDSVRKALALSNVGGVVTIEEALPGIVERRCAVWALSARTEIIGYVLLLEDEQRPWSADDLALSKALVSNAGVFIDNARLFRQVRMLAERDDLTGLLNRREFFRQAELAHANGLASGEPFSVVMFDADRFKLFNDTHGHAVGDEVLKMISQVCRAAVVPHGILGRYGGEEFAAVLPGATASAAMEIAEELRVAVSEAQLVGAAGQLLNVTVSVGVATRSGGESLADLLSVADAALYASKEAGRNRVTLGSPVPSPQE